jgi:hypothetical protein
LAINWLEDWAHFTSALRLAHVHITEAEDELVWNFPNVGGKYSMKMGYQVLINIENGDNCWWYKPMWSLKGPLKESFSSGSFYKIECSPGKEFSAGENMVLDIVICVKIG